MLPLWSNKVCIYERFSDIGSSDFDQSEEEEIEACASSMDSSMRVYYP